MRPYHIDIKEIENDFVITINKKQLSSDYILNLINWLQLITYEPDELNNYFKQLQQNLINETPVKKRVWNFSGSVSLNHQIDKINLRDLAYD